MEIFNYTPLMFVGVPAVCVVLLLIGMALGDLRLVLRRKRRERANRPAVNGRRVVRFADQRERELEAELQAMLVGQ